MLAAGAGRRFAGGHKLLAEWRGQPILGHVLATAHRARQQGLIDQVLVVHAPGDLPVRDLAVAAGCTPVVADRAAHGMSASLRAGVEALPPGDAVVVLLGDQPAVRVETIAALIAAGGPLSRALVRPRYASDPENPGHPVLVGRVHWPLAEAAEGDRGLEPAVRERGLTWRLVPMAGRSPDVDTITDLARLKDLD